MEKEKTEKENREKENYTAYDLEPELPADPAKAVNPLKSNNSKKSETNEHAENPENSEKSDNPADSGDAGNTANPQSPLRDEEAGDPSGARAEIEAMIGEMGAERVLQILRGNRNAAIEQIIGEMEQQSSRTLQSGASIGGASHSIFDLASLA